MAAGLRGGTKTIPAAGSQPVQLAVEQDCTSVLIFNPTGNSTVYVGDSAVTSSDGIPVAAGQSLSLDTPRLDSVYLAGTENDIVRYLATDQNMRV